MIASCGLLEDELRLCSKEGVTVADRVETLGVDLETRVKRLGVKEKNDKEEVQGEILAHQEEQGLPKELDEGAVKKLLRAGMVPARTWGVHAVEMALTESLNMTRQMAAAAGKRIGDLAVLVYGKLWPRGGRRALYCGCSDLGRRGVDWQMAHRTKRNTVAPGFRVSDVETRERTCRSGDVRDSCHSGTP